MQLSAHRIRRQRWLCRAGSQEEAFDLRGRLRAALEEAVPAAFERAFDAAVRGDEVVRIPRLELRIRLARVEDLQALLPELLRRAASEQLASLLRPDERPSPAAAIAMRRSSRESRLDGLIRYLETGALPWELAQSEAAALAELLRETASEELAAVLDRAPDARAPFPQALAFFFRLLQLLPLERWAAVVGHISPPLPAEPGLELQRVLSAVAGAPQVLDTRLRLAAAALAAARREPGRELAVALAEIRAVTPEVSGKSAHPDPSPPDPLSHPLPPAGRGGTETETGGGAPLPVEGSAWPGQRPVRSGVRGQGSDDSAAFFEPRLQPAAATEALPLAVRSAGLVLLHPFLPRLFGNTGLLHAGEPGLRPAELPRAAALLHWLASGREEVFEFELGFVKVLLGLRPEAPLPVGGGLLTEADLAEGEALLQAAIGHWKAIKGTTPAGLRSSFLQRGGLLREDDAGWRLQMEPAAFDMLLDHLPWGIGVVKLPWLKQPIFTDWPTP